MALPFNRTTPLTIYSNGPLPTDAPTQSALKKVLATGITLDTRPIVRLINNGEGPENGITLHFETGDPVRLGMLLHRPATRNRGYELIEQLGLDTKPNGDVVADPMMLQGSVEGVIVAGDTQESIKQAIMAAGNGGSSLHISQNLEIPSYLCLDGPWVGVLISDTSTGVRAGAVITFQLADEEGNRALAALEKSEKQQEVDTANAGSSRATAGSETEQKEKM